MHVMRVFFPDHAIKARSGLCIGWMDYRVHTICVLAVVHLPLDPHKITRQLQMATSVRQRPLTILGPLTHPGDPDSDRIQRLCHSIYQRLCMELTRPDPYSLPMCKLLREGRPTTQDYHFVLYSQSKIRACCLPSVAAETPSDTQSSMHQPSLSGDGGGAREEEGRTVIDIEVVLSIIQEGTCQLHALTGWDVSMDVKSDGGKPSPIHRLFTSIVQIVVSTVNFSLLPFRTSFCNRLSQNRIFQMVVRFPQTGCQILAKYDSLQSVLDSHCEDSDGRCGFSGKAKTKTNTEVETGHESLRIGNLWTHLLIDTLLGVLLMWWIQHYDWPDIWAEWIISSANTTAGSLQRLLQWLMGAPAGLKLNSALAHFLGQFFLYHVYLWIGYLAIIRPVLGWVIWCMSLTGCLGVSVILAVASDMVSMLTFHIYCFYVYATKLYNLQLTGLLALSRLFRGKKWNVLRKRVDTCNYDVDQLFIGTLLFTILLFLLPTTSLFYAVFTLLRLAVIALKAILTKTIDVLKNLPVYSVLLCLCGSDMLMSGVRFDVMLQPGEGCSKALVMEIQPMGVFEALQLSYSTTKKESSQKSSRHPLISLGSDLLTGRLIYPWQLAQTKST